MSSLLFAMLLNTLHWSNHILIKKLRNDLHTHTHKIVKSGGSIKNLLTYLLYYKIKFISYDKIRSTS